MDYLSKKTYITLLTIGMICNMVIILLFYFQSIAVIDKTSHENLKSILKSNAMMIENNTKNTELLSHQLSNILTSTISLEDAKNNEDAMNIYENEITPLFLNTIKTFEAKSGWVIFDNDVVPSSKTISFIKNGSEYSRQPEYKIRETEFYKDTWWINAIENGTAWSSPYYWELWDATIISYSEQIKIDDIVIGVGGSDLFFEDISNKLKSVKIYDTGYVTLINAKFDIIFDHDFNNIGKNFKTYSNNDQYEKYATEIEAGNDFDILEFKDHQETTILGYQKLSNGWTLLTIPKKHEMYDDLNKLNLILIIVILIMIVLAQVYYRILCKNYSKKEGI